jgi:hypothetical protein
LQSEQSFDPFYNLKVSAVEPRSGCGQRGIGETGFLVCSVL